MLSVIKSVTEQAPAVAARELTLIVRTEPWLRVFLRNIGDLFRPAPPQVWMTARPAEYWRDALVHRPVAWSRLRQSVLCHTLVVLFVYWVNLLWLSRPQVLPVELPRTTITHYQLSEYLPPINIHREKPAPPARRHAQAADPEYAPQEIVSIHPSPSSLKQTIVQPNPTLLTRDVPLPNIMAMTTIPAAPVASNRSLQALPLEIPNVAAPSQPPTKSRLTFPVQPAPEVIAPAASVAANHATRAVPTAAPDVVPPAPSAAAAHSGPVLPVAGPVVVAPAQQPIAHSNLQIAAQAPEVAPPATTVAPRRTLAATLPETAPQVVAPSQSVTGRNLSAAALPAPAQTAVPPSQPIAAGGTNPAAMGQLLALNAQPVAPSGPVTVPEGIHRGEFAASPAGRPNATARPEITAGDTAGSNHSGESSAPADVYISAPPVKVAGNNTLVMSPRSIPPIRALPPARSDVPADRFDSEIFGLRRRYSVRLSMPNLNSAIGSWIMRFARLNSEPGHEEEVSAPEPLRKVDPAYPASFVHDRIEGVVVLYAIIHTDGSVGSVRVLEGFEPKLDENARTALEQWRFRPGTRHGVPVEVEAVVHVPFRVPKAAF